jgi:hypothetical protein
MAPIDILTYGTEFASFITGTTATTEGNFQFSLSGEILQPTSLLFVGTRIFTAPLCQTTQQISHRNRLQQNPSPS